MRVWFPTIRAGSGSDIYVERLVAGLRLRGIDAQLQWFDHRYELVPALLGRVRPPAGTSIVHANSWNGFAFARAGMPLVVAAFHCVYRCGYPEWKTYAQACYHNGWIGRYEQKSFRSAAAAVTLTPSAAADFQERFALPPLSVIHGWVNTELFMPTSSRAVVDGRIRILIVGNHSKRKGMDLLPQLRAQLGGEFAISVAGGLRAEHGGACAGVTYLPLLSEAELVRAYQDSDLIVSLSRHEGFGYSALEGMACGKPVVAFDVTGLRDVVMPDVSGMLVPVNDVGALARACAHISKQPGLAGQMGESGRAMAIGRFGEDHAIAAYIRMYESLV